MDLDYVMENKMPDLIEMWELELDNAGPFAGNDFLKAHYEKAPEGAPSAKTLKSWLLANGIIVGN